MGEDSFDWDRQVRRALESTEFMALSTPDARRGSWICPLQFSYDGSLNLCFRSMPDSRHMQNIERDNRVAAAIYTTERIDGDHPTGIQLYGEAEVAQTLAEAVAAARTHYRRGKNQRSFIDMIDERREWGDVSKWNFVFVRTREAWLIGSALFKTERYGRKQIPLETLHLFDDRSSSPFNG